MADSIYHTTYTDQYRCTTVGVWLERHVESSQIRQLTTGELAGTQDVESLYDPPFLVMPAGVEVGDSWTSVASGTQVWRGNSNGGVDIDYTIDSTALDTVEMTVEAGTFTTLYVQSFSTYTPTYAENYYYDASAGEVFGRQFELVSISG